MQNIRPVQSNNELLNNQNNEIKAFTPISTTLTTHYFNLFFNCSSWNNDKGLCNLLQDLQDSDLNKSKTERKDFSFVYKDNKISFFIVYWKTTPETLQRSKTREKLTISFNFQNYFQFDSNNNALKNYPLLFNYLLSKIIGDESTVNLKDRCFIRDYITFNFSDLWGVDKMFSRKSIAKKVLENFIKNFSTFSFNFGKIDGFFNFIKSCTFEGNSCTIHFMTETNSSLPPPFFVNLFLDSYINASENTFKSLDSKEFLLYHHMKYMWKQKARNKDSITITYKYILEKIINRKLGKHNAEFIRNANDILERIADKITDEKISVSFQDYGKISTEEIIDKGFINISFS